MGFAIGDPNHQGMLPDNFVVMGYARRGMSDSEFRESLASRLTCRVSAGKSCEGKMEEFLAKCFYTSGESYDSEQGFRDLSNELKRHELDGVCER